MYAILWNVKLCDLVKNYQRLGTEKRSHIYFSALRVGIGKFDEALVNSYQIAGIKTHKNVS
jgi:hypothetical protein